ARAYQDAREVSILAQFRDFDRLDRRTQVAQYVAQKIVGHRALWADTLQLGRHRGGLQRADPDWQVELVVWIFEHNDRHLGGRIERQSAHYHQNEVFPARSHDECLYPAAPFPGDS